MINGWSIFRRVLALFIVSITQDTSNVSESVQAMIFLENKFIILGIIIFRKLLSKLEDHNYGSKEFP